MMPPRIETAISAGLSAPMPRPRGASTRASSSSVTPRSRTRANISLRFSLLEMNPTKVLAGARLQQWYRMSVSTRCE